MPTAPAAGLQRFDALALLLQEQAAQAAAAAVAEPPSLLDQPVLPGPQPAPCANSLRQELAQLAAGCFEGEAGEVGFVGLRDLGPHGAAAAPSADVRSHPAAPRPVPAASARPRPGLPAFLLQAFDGAAQPGDSTAAAGHHPAPSSAAAATVPAADRLFTLEAPVLPVAAMARGPTLVAGAPTAAFAHLFQPLALPAPVPPPAACLAPRGCAAASLAALLAADMQLEGSGLVLPPVELVENREAEPGGCFCTSVPCT